MNATNFYVTLLSNTHEGDVIGDFKITLPSTLNLTGRYECALVNLIYPYAFDSITADVEEVGDDGLTLPENGVHIGYQVAGKRMHHVVRIPPGHYKDADMLTERIDEAIREIVQLLTEYRPVNPFISYDPISRYCVVSTEDPVTEIVLSRKLSYILGLPRRTLNRISSFGEHPVNFTKELVYVYADCCEFQIVSNVWSPLLRVFAVTGEYGENVQVDFDRPQYIPVREAIISKIHIQLKNDRDEVIRFNAGRVCAVVHFRKAQNW